MGYGSFALLENIWSCVVNFMFRIHSISSVTFDWGGESGDKNVEYREWRVHLHIPNRGSCINAMYRKSNYRGGGYFIHFRYLHK